MSESPRAPESDAIRERFVDEAESLCDCDAYRGSDPEWHGDKCPTQFLRALIDQTYPPERDGKMRYVLGFYCPKGNGHFEMYADPDAEMACGSHMIEISIDGEAGEWLHRHDLLPAGRWEGER